MKINDLGIELIKSFEGCRLTAYKDVVGIWTIGFGHVGDIAQEGREIDQETADAILCEDLGKFEDGVSALVRIPISENAFSALVCFAFNLGLHALAGSTLLKKVNSSDPSAKDEFGKWCKAGGKVIPGLVRRRTAEAQLFVS